MLHKQSFWALALCCFSSATAALEIGFESRITASASDNIEGSNRDIAVEGQRANAQFGVFGEQRGTRARGAFSGELLTSRRLDDPDDNFTSISQFAGALEFQITPRALTWYVGDILGTVNVDDGLTVLNAVDEVRRNVFVTGPEFKLDTGATSRFQSRILYVDQSQDGLDLESLINANASWSFDTDRGNTFGIAANDVFTDNPEENLEGDFNRFSLVGTWSRDRGRNSYEAQFGVTRFTTIDDSLDGVNASLAYTRRLGPQTDFRVSFTQDLRDQTLNTINALITDGSVTELDGDGFFDESRIDARYSFASSISTFSIGMSASLLDFRLLNDGSGFSAAGDLEDRTNFGLFANYSYVFSPRTRVFASVNFDVREFDNRIDNSQSVLASAQLIRNLSRSFSVELGYRAFASQGETTNIVLNAAPTVDEIDVVENRVFVGLRWAPPSRASQDLTIELKTLLQ